MTKVRSPFRFDVFSAIVLLALVVANGCSSGSTTGAEVSPSAAVLELQTFLTNISDPSGERYCKLTITLAITPAQAVKSIEKDALLIARIRDRILTLVTDKTYLELSDPETKEAFREEMRIDISSLLNESRVEEVLFSEFVVQ